MKLTIWREVDGVMTLVPPSQIHSDGRFELVIVSKELKSSGINISEDEDGYLSAKLIDIDLELG